MSRPRRPRTPSYANVMSTIAVFVALGTGGAYAANTIGSADIIDGSVTSADVRNATLLGGDIAPETIRTGNIAEDTIRNYDIYPNAIRGSRIANDSLTGTDVDESSLGTVPQAGHAASASEAAHATSAGHATQAGKAPVQGYQVLYRQAPFDQTVDKEQTVEVPCPPGKRPISGGALTYTGAHNPDGNEVAIKESRPVGMTYTPDDNRPTGWRVTAEATDRASYLSVIYVTAYAVCAETDLGF